MGGFFAISFTLDRSPYTPQKYSGQTQEQALPTNQAGCSSLELEGRDPLSIALEVGVGPSCPCL